MAFGDLIIVVCGPDVKSAGASLKEENQQTAGEDVETGCV
jgi:hypothetical protein